MNQSLCQLETRSSSQDSQPHNIEIVQKSSSGFDLKPGAILTVPAQNSESRFGKSQTANNELINEPNEVLLVGDGEFTLTPEIKKIHESFNENLVSCEKYERRITVEGIPLSQPQTIQVEDETKVYQMIEDQETSILKEL